MFSRRMRRLVSADSCLVLASNLHCQGLSIRQFLLANLVRPPDSDHLRLRIPIKTLALNLDRMGDFAFNDPDKVRYDGQTLIVRGTRSHYVPDDVLPLIGRFFPMFKLVDIDSGHWLISEKPEAFRQGTSWIPYHGRNADLLAVVDFLQDGEGRDKGIGY